ncbi:MAG TPA: hypothetical protein VGG48_16315 [Rhizomicrobium sp.]|jgi:hypothetical protein
MKKFLLIAALLGFASAAFAGENWDGTWAGNWGKSGDGVQIIIVNDEIGGFYYHGIYMDGGRTDEAPGTFSFHFPGGNATLTRAGDKTAHIVIHQSGKPDLSFDVTKD